jgi:hypothetical protein
LKQRFIHQKERYAVLELPNLQLFVEEHYVLSSTKKMMFMNGTQVFSI